MSARLSSGALRAAVSASSRTAGRSVHVSAVAQAAAPAASSATPRYVRRTPTAATSRTASARPVSSSKAAPAPAAVSPAASQAEPPVPAASPMPASAGEYSDFDYGAPANPPASSSNQDTSASPSAPAPSSYSGSSGSSSYSSTAPRAQQAQSLPDAPSLNQGSSAGGIPGEISAPSGADWSTSFQGLSEKPFSKEAIEALLKPIHPDDVELKPDGLLYLPEIKYRRVLNQAFGPGGWGLAPRGETSVTPRIVSREWGLVCLGRADDIRLVGIARGEQEYFDPSGIPTATEACKSNALMRCCKDLGIASELWDPRFIREYKEKYCVECMVEHVVQKKKRKLWRKKDGKFDYPYKEISRV